MNDISELDKIWDSMRKLFIEDCGRNQMSIFALDWWLTRKGRGWLLRASRVALACKRSDLPNPSNRLKLSSLLHSRLFLLDHQQTSQLLKNRYRSQQRVRYGTCGASLPSTAMELNGLPDRSAATRKASQLHPVRAAYSGTTASQHGAIFHRGNV